MNRYTRGFTLIELLVVVAIIGLLSAVVLTSLTQARMKADDARRLSDLREMQKALEAYASDNGGQYPSTSNTWNSQCSTGGGSGGNLSPTAVIPNLVPKYIGQLPVDPMMVPNSGSTVGTCCYLYKSNGTDYKLMVGYNCPTAVYTNAAMVRALDPLRDGGTVTNPVPANCTGSTICAWAAYSSTTPTSNAGYTW